MSTEQDSVLDILEDDTYKYGFTTDVESETFAKGWMRMSSVQFPRRRKSHSLCSIFGSRRLRNGKP